MTLMTPPVEPPYSAAYPADFTWTSSRKSARRGTALVPIWGLVVSMPSMTKRFSEPEEPSIEMPPACDSFVAPAAWETTSVKSRPRGMRSMRSREMLVVVEDEVMSIALDSPTTLTVSVTVARPRVKSTLAVLPTVRSTELSPVAKPEREALTT